MAQDIAADFGIINSILLQSGQKAFFRGRWERVSRLRKHQRFYHRPEMCHFPDKLIAILRCPHRNPGLRL
ncbi:MAG: hypothetical protein IH846_10235 [Acidobacteria bacterium]|nr:hypothetical protein [Acidobacteriota bacterium]